MSLETSSLNGPIAIDLPGGVWLDGTGEQPVRRRVFLRTLTAEDVVTLLDNADRAPAERATKLLAGCLFDGDRIAPALSIGDREAALLHLRRVTIGEVMDAVLGCPDPDCGARLELQLRIADLLVAPYPERDAVHRVSITALDGDYTISFRPPNGNDLAAIVSLARDDVARAATAILRRCVVVAEHDGQPVDVEALPELVTSSLGQVMVDCDPQAELHLDLKCPDCEREFTVFFDTTAFFLRELDEWVSGLTRDVHLLASRYHWSEREILQMPASRRARYLELVAASSGEGWSA